VNTPLAEGFTDRARLHDLGVMALAMMSNQLTAEQAEKLAAYARQYAAGRVGLMHDADVAGDGGAKESLWRLHELGIEAYLVWSRKKFAGKCADREPESLSGDECRSVAGGVVQAPDGGVA
jgi:DNA primase